MHSSFCRNSLLSVLVALGFSMLVPQVQAQESGQNEVLVDQVDDFDGLFIAMRGATNTDIDPTTGDDFVVPDGETWIIKELFIDGEYFQQPDPHPDGPAACLQADIGFWANGVDRPSDQVVFNQDVAVQSDDAGKLTFVLPDSELNSGTYWLTVQCIGNLDIGSSGPRIFYWSRNDNGGTSAIGWPAVSITPNGQFGFPSSGWHSLVEISGYETGLDMSFRMSGTRSTSTDLEVTELASDYVLHGAYPNPFNPSTSIGFDLPVSTPVYLDVVDVMGRRVLSPIQGGVMAAGRHDVRIDAGNLPSGIYMVRMQAGQFIKTTSVILSK